MLKNQTPNQPPSFKRTILFGLKIIAMIVLILFIVVFLIIYSIFGITPTQQREKFLDHVHSNAPEPYKDCLVTYIDTHWEAVHEKYHQDVKNDAVRVPRVETDVVNQMVNEYLPVCNNAK